MATEHKSPSDLMIVKITDSDYYVSEKKKGAEVYRKLLVDRNETSMHFDTYDKAYDYALEYAERLKKKNNPDCIIFDIDIKDYPKDRPMRIGYFNYRGVDYPLSFVASNDKVNYDIGSLTYYRPMIDKSFYEKSIQEKIDSVEGNNAYFDGKIRGYKYALRSNLGYIYTNIFLGIQVVKSCDEDIELYSYDKEYYQGYIDALIECVDLQKAAEIAALDFNVYIYDATKYEGQMDLDKKEFYYRDSFRFHTFVYDELDRFIDDSLHSKMTCVPIIIYNKNHNGAADYACDMLPDPSKFFVLKYKHSEKSNWNEKTFQVTNQVMSAVKSYFSLGKSDSGIEPKTMGITEYLPDDYFDLKVSTEEEN